MRIQNKSTAVRNISILILLIVTVLLAMHGKQLSYRNNLIKKITSEPFKDVLLQKKYRVYRKFPSFPTLWRQGNAAQNKVFLTKFPIFEKKFYY